MKSNTEIINKFDSYIKKSLKNELITYVRSETIRQKKYVNFSDLNKTEQNELVCIDKYSFDLFDEKTTTHLFNAVINNELLQEALLSIKPRSRKLILLKYCGNMTDAEVGEFLNMSQTTVNKHKIRTLKN